MKYNKEELEKIDNFLRVHLGDEHTSMSAEQKVEVLEAKKKRLRLLTVINVVGVIFFGYWFWADITQLNDMIMYGILIVFAINLFFFRYQKVKLNQVLDYLQQDVPPYSELKKDQEAKVE